MIFSLFFFFLFPGPDGEVNAIAFSPDLQGEISPPFFLPFRVWEKASWPFFLQRCLSSRVLTGRPDVVRGLFSPHKERGAKLFFSSPWQTYAPTLRTIGLPLRNISGMDFSAGRPPLLSDVRVWDVTSVVQGIFPLPSSFSPFSRWHYIGRCGPLRGRTSLFFFFFFFSSQAAIYAIAFAPDGAPLPPGGGDGPPAVG